MLSFSDIALSENEEFDGIDKDVFRTPRVEKHYGDFCY